MQGKQTYSNDKDLFVLSTVILSDLKIKMICQTEFLIIQPSSTSKVVTLKPSWKEFQKSIKQSCVRSWKKTVTSVFQMQ